MLIRMKAVNLSTFLISINISLAYNDMKQTQMTNKYTNVDDNEVIYRRKNYLDFDLNTYYSFFHFQ